MAWHTSDRRSRLPDDWPQLRSQVRKRAGNQCEWVLEGGRRCPTPGSDCDHVIPGDDHSMGNLQWLCYPHHKVKTTQDNARAQALRLALRVRPTPPHPGRRTP